MADPFLGEIRMFGGNFAPRGWAFCNGQILPISQNTALFALLGTTYGGDGQTTFALPDLQGAAPLHAGEGPGLSSRPLGERGGQQAVSLTTANLPAHTHAVAGEDGYGTNAAAANGVWARSAGVRGMAAYASEPGTPRVMNAGAVAASGGGQPHNNMPPYLALTFIIALQGIFPSRG